MLHLHSTCASCSVCIPLLISHINADTVAEDNFLMSTLCCIAAQVLSETIMTISGVNLSKSACYIRHEHMYSN